jgi:hypothetical protein
MNKKFLLALLTTGLLQTTYAQNVGIGTNTPTSKLHIEQTAGVDAVGIDHNNANGNGLELRFINPANGGNAMWVRNGGNGISLEAQSLNATNASPNMVSNNAGLGLGLFLLQTNNGANASAIQIDQDGTGALSRGVDAYLDAANISEGYLLFHSGTGMGIYTDLQNTANASTGHRLLHAGTGSGHLITLSNATNASAGVFVRHDGTGDGFSVNATGSGWGLFNNITGTGGGVFNNTGNIGMYNNFTNTPGAKIGSFHFMDNVAGGAGSITTMDGQDGDGYTFINVDNATTPTTGGDGFGFRATVNTQTAIVGNTIFGGLFSGTQFGPSHGILVTHEGVSGRGIEVNLNGVNNTDVNYFGVSNGQGGVFVGQNQSNTITGIISVADFSYTGTDLDDHIGVQGSSTPAPGSGIGVRGSGGWYGVFSQNDMGAAGAKTFIIDHPQDPENKMLKHFSVESNEVLNLYRGVIQLDANGQATVELPSYFESINKDYSYQLTAIGTPQQPYIKEEIQGNTFVVAGVPNTKVSWTVYADRNDRYIQQNPSKSIDVVEKTGSRKGKYISPQLYNQPATKGMFYNKNVEEGAKTTKAAPQQLPIINTDQLPTPKNTAGITKDTEKRQATPRK